MKSAIPCLYSEYGRYTDKLRMIPYYIDCLKPVERRILYALYNLPKKLLKSARVVGDTIGKYHPHGDQSTYDSLVSLVWRGYVQHQGNFGSMSMDKPRPAAYRYTQVALEPLLSQFAFDLIKYVPFSDPENLNELQPNYLTSPIPVGLIGEGLISGISFHTTKIPRFTLSDLILRLENVFQRELDPTIPPKTIIPNLPNFDIYETNPGDFERILTEGKGTITIVPKITVDHEGVHVFGKPPSGVSSWIRQAQQKNYNILDLSSTDFEAVFVKDGLITQDFVNDVFEIVTTKLHFNCCVIDKNETVKQVSIDYLLRESYDIWQNHLKEKYQDDLSLLNQKLFEIQVIEVVRAIINKYNVNLQKIDNILEIFRREFSQGSPITEDDIRQICSKKSIKALIEYTFDKQTILTKIQKIEQDLQNIVTVAYEKLISYK